MKTHLLAILLGIMSQARFIFMSNSVGDIEKIK